MTFDYAVCPHCGCHCEDDEYCAACGKLFHDEEVPTRNVSLLGLLGSGLRSVIKKKRSDDYVYAQDNDVVLDPEYSSLSCNVFNEDRWSK
ncbi:hypothetical protein [Desulfogranum marinum]|uniref:hypothetical protein n=1 Tax=Desulfogranum marinum TaxID=453220 RepID=UPI0019652405|nr:hypothetical protein [Desulfogranum marinum]MBM9514075.1 hypothetical protein [Desulfogranum marinum]